MPRQTVFPQATLRQFRDLFQSRREYRGAINEMDLKERSLNWKPTTELEKALKLRLNDNALMKAGAGMVRVTSYLLNDGDDECSAYISYGGKALQVTAEGREGDQGFFLIATQSQEGLTVRAKSKREHYWLRTLVVNVAMVILGLFFAVIPGLVAIVAIAFVEPRSVDRRIEKFIWPALSAFLGTGGRMSQPPSTVEGAG